MYILLSEAPLYIPNLMISLSVSPQRCAVWCLRSGFPSVLTRSRASCLSASPSTLDGWALSSPCWVGVLSPAAPQSHPPHLAPTRTTIGSITPNREVATRQQPPPPITPRAPTSEMGEILQWMCLGL